MELKRKKRLRRCGIAILVLLALLSFCDWQNNGLMQTEYDCTLPPEHAALDGVRIAQISDLHNKDFAGRLEGLLNEARPDLILITGDLVDRRTSGSDAALSVVRQAAALAPTCYVPGNHEASLDWRGDYQPLRSQLEQAGVRVLENRAEILNLRGGTLRLIGLSDPWFYGRDLEESAPALAQDLSQLAPGEGLKVLLAHRPSLFAWYAESGVDLVFSGHVHGGQVRLPLVGGLVGPDEGFFPDYVSGLYQMDQTTMVVSRGLGNSIIPQRLFNRPELVVVTLRAE